MIRGIGIDLCEIARIEAQLEKDHFMRRCFTEGERAYIASRGKGAAESLAGHYAAKEAGLKALGCGIAFALTDIEVVHDALGAPGFLLHGKAQERLEALGGSSMHLSITHERGMAAAVAIVEA